MKLAEFMNVETGKTVYVAPEMVGAIGTSDRGVLIILKTGIAFHVQGLVESTARVLHQAQQQEWTPPDKQLTKGADGIEYGLM